MTKVVMDTNILVSALLSPFGAPGRVMDMFLTGRLTICFDSRILAEYEEVLLRPKFGFSKRDVRSLMEFIYATGLSVIPAPITVNLPDEDDRVFLEVAKHCGAYLITRNRKHFPEDDSIVSATEFLEAQHR